jgi:hypothetical protein
MLGPGLPFLAKARAFRLGRYLEKPDLISESYRQTQKSTGARLSYAGVDGERQDAGLTARAGR